MLRASVMFALAMMSAPLVQAQEQQRLVKLVKAEQSEASITRQFFGHVVAKETVDLAFQLGGQVVEIPIVEGEPIAKGDIVAQLDLEPFQLALDQAVLQKEQADRNVNRFQKLQGSTVSQVTVDDAITQAKLADIAIRDAQRSLREATLRAPFDALVASRNVANFTTISAGTPIARLHDMSELRVEIDVSEVVFQSAGVDAEVELWAKFPTSDQRYELETREFNAETSDVGQTFQITLGMAPPEDIVILPGSSVTVFATINGGDRAIRIPNSAVITDTNGDPMVMAFTPEGDTEGTVSAVKITIEPSANGAVIVTQGLEKGQEVVASGANMLTEGERVTRFTGFSN